MCFFQIPSISAAQNMLNPKPLKPRNKMQRRKHPNYCSWVVFISQKPEEKGCAQAVEGMDFGNLIESSQNKKYGCFLKWWYPQDTPK